MYKIFLLLLLSTFLSAKVYDGVAIVVQNKAITMLDIKNEMKISHVDAKNAADLLIRKKLEEGEIDKRKITVSSSEVYDDIKKMAKRNRMNVNDFYDAVLESNGLSSTQLKKKIKEKLLGQKLYSSVTYNSITKPSEADIKEYYDTHKSFFEHPSAFNVIVYNCPHKEKLQQKIDNPMFYSSEITKDEIKLLYKKISPSLAKLLKDTPLNTCSSMIPDGKGNYVSFYIKGVEASKENNISTVTNQIINAINNQKREQVLGDYFARLKHNADINIIREVK